MNEAIPNNIAKYRKAKGMSQEDLAAKLKMSVTQVSRLERGVSSLRHTRITKLTEILGVTTEDLFRAGPDREGVDLRVIHDVIVQLDHLFRRLEIDPSPEQRAELTIEIYRPETDVLDEDQLQNTKSDLKKYEGMLRSITKT